MMRATRRTASGGFTLVELLVVIAIIALISAIALPTVLPALNERRVSEAARILQATLAGTRDAAIRANAPRGIRLLTDPVFNLQTDSRLASNRIIPIEPGPDYTEGLIVPVTNNTSSTIPIYYQNIYNYYNNSPLPNAKQGQYLIFAEADFTGGIPSNPTNWAMNVRQGDKIRFADSGAYYTIAGPIGGYPFNLQPTTKINQNFEHVISCFLTNAAVPPLASQANWLPEFLFLMNGTDDNGNGWIDEECDGIDNDGDGIIDPGFNGIDDDGVNGVDDPAELQIGKNLGNGIYSGTEFEQETLVSTESLVLSASSSQSAPQPQAYTIFRRPVVSPGARETTLPAGVVIDLTSFNISSLGTGFLPERSRLPVDASTYSVDIMIDQTGRVITQGAGSDGGGAYKNSPLSSLPFYHFWLAEREDVQPLPNPLPNNQSLPLLPLPKGTLGYNGPVFLTGERRLVTLFVKTGQIVSNSIQNFSVNDVNIPFYDAQSGIKESQ